MITIKNIWEKDFRANSYTSLLPKRGIKHYQTVRIKKVMNKEA